MADVPDARQADLNAVKCLASPLRQRILRELHEHGPATSTGLAQALGVTTGGTSYNLRVLAAHGFVVEVPDRGHGKERWWRAVPQDLRLPTDGERDPATRAAIDRLEQLWLTEDAAALSRFLAARGELGEWADALPYSRGTVRLTLAGLRAFFEDYLELLRRYQRDAGDGEGRLVQARFLAFPTVEDEPTDGGKGGGD